MNNESFISMNILQYHPFRENPILRRFRIGLLGDADMVVVEEEQSLGIVSYASFILAFVLHSLFDGVSLPSSAAGSPILRRAHHRHTGAFRYSPVSSGGFCHSDCSSMVQWFCTSGARKQYMLQRLS